MYRKHRQECHYDPRRNLPLPRAHTRTCPRVGQRARRLPRDGYPLCDLLSLAVTGKALRSRGTSTTFSCASAGSWICAARTSHQCSPGGGRRLPVGGGGVPAESLSRPIAPSSWTTSGVTSRFSSPSRSWRGLECRRRVVSFPAVASYRRR